MKTKTTRKPKAIVLDETNVVQVLDQIGKNCPYTASIKIFGVIYTSLGSTVRNALENLKVGGKVGGICVLTMKKGDVSKEKILNAGQLFRLFTSSPIMREISLKNISNLFDL